MTGEGTELVTTHILRAGVGGIYDLSPVRDDGNSQATGHILRHSFELA